MSFLSRFLSKNLTRHELNGSCSMLGSALISAATDPVVGLTVGLTASAAGPERRGSAVGTCAGALSVLALGPVAGVLNAALVAAANRALYAFVIPDSTMKAVGAMDDIVDVDAVIAAPQHAETKPVAPAPAV